MICGNCKDRNATVAHVRDCYAGRTIQSQVKAIGSPVPDLGSGTKPVLPVTEPGIYVDGDCYYKVVQNQDRTRLYAKVWDAEWVYAPGAIKRLTADMKANAEQAARFGKLWGSCVFCTRLLTDERSVAVGYGPICADHNGLPWGEKEVTA